MEYVIEKQKRPLKRIRCEQNRMWVGKTCTVVRSFMKKEAYGKVTDPRNISTVPPSHTMSLSCYTYAAKEEVFRKLPWFMPCQTPREITEAVMDLVNGQDYVLSCDYSRLDGTIDAFLRKL